MLALFAPCFFFSCGRAADEEKSIEVIPIGEAYRSPSSFLNASDCFTKIRYVPLETSDSALVGDRPVVWIVGDRLIISSDHGCLAFDKNSGRFLNSIGHIGNDPEGSLTLSGWPNAAAGHVYFSAGNGRSVIYDVAGHFVGDYRDQEVTDGLFGVDTYDYLNDSTTVVHLPATLDKPDRILLYRGDSLLASYPSHGEPVSPLSGNMADILKMEMFQQESAYDAEMFLENDLTAFRNVLGADAVMFTIIKDWRRNNVGGKLKVNIEYILRSTKTGQTLYQREGEISVDTSVNSGGGGFGALASLIATAINTAATDKVIAGRKCNAFVLSDLPAGKYSNQYEVDKRNPAGKPVIKATVK